MMPVDDQLTGTCPSDRAWPEETVAWPEETEDPLVYDSMATMNFERIPENLLRLFLTECHPDESIALFRRKIVLGREHVRVLENGVVGGCWGLARE